MRGFAAIALYNPINPLNVGSVLRACYCYDVKLIALGGSQPQRYMNSKRGKLVRGSTDTTSAYKNIPLIMGDLRNLVPYDCVPVAVDILPGARSLPDYTHPDRAFYIFGPENSTLGKTITEWCRDKVYIPTKTCLNLGATVNTLLYDRMSKVLCSTETNKTTANT